MYAMPDATHLTTLLQTMVNTSSLISYALKQTFFTAEKQETAVNFGAIEIVKRVVNAHIRNEDICETGCSIFKELSTKGSIFHKFNTARQFLYS